MPSGKVHFRLYKSYAPAFAVSVALDAIGVHVNAAAYFGGALAGYALGALIDPDLDQAGITAAEGRALLLGPLALLWLPAWMPYGIFMKHRSFWSHYPLVSTFIRLVYILSIPIAIMLYFKIISFNDMRLLSEFAVSLLGVLKGLSVADTIHWAADFGLTWEMMRRAKK